MEIANIFFSIIQFILIVYILIQEVKAKSPSVFMWGTLFIMFGIMHLIDTVFHIGEYESIIMIQASLFVSFFCLFYIIFRRIFRMPKMCWTSNIQSFMKNQCERRAKDELLYIFLLIACFVLVERIITVSGGLLNTSWGLQRNITSELNYVRGEQLASILYYSLGGLSCVAIIKKEKTHFLFVLLCILFVELVLRSRALLLPLLVSVLAYFLFRIKKLKLKAIIAGIFAAGSSVFLLAAVRAIRWMGSLNDIINKFSFDELWLRMKMFLETSNGELGYRNWFYYFILHNNQFPNFEQGHTYIRMLLVYLPTGFSFGLKPSDFAISMGSAIGMSDGGSMHPTLFGDAYANFGIGGILLGVLWAAIVSLCDWLLISEKIETYKVLMFVLMSCGFVTIGRGAVYNGFLLIAWGVPLLFVMGYISSYRPVIKINEYKKI